MYDPKFIEKLEKELSLNPKAYQSKVTMLALLGNLYIVFGIVVLLVLLFLACLSILVLKAFAIKIIIPVAIFLYIIIRSLWVSIEKPQGIEISKHDAPQLFLIIDDLSQKLNSPNFHHVLITEDFNAAVVQRAKLGIFGWYENYLIIGLPMLQSLTVEQLTSVLAHEFGHLSKNHARTANWIYRQRIRWVQLYMLIEQNSSKIDIIFRPFFKRFVPYFTAYSFPIARANEYEADKISVDLTSVETVAETLSTVNVIGCYLSEEFWPKIFNRTEDLPNPNIAPYLGYVQQLSEYIQTDTTSHWLEKSLSLRTDFEDTHPSLSDRLRAIGQPAKVVFAEQGNTADSLLGQRLTEITAVFDHKWQTEVLEAWQQQYQDIQQQKEYLVQINEKLAQSFELSLEEKFDQVDLTDRIMHQPAVAFQLMEKLYQEQQDHPLANFMYGRYLINQKNASAVAVLEKAMQLHEFNTLRCCELLYQYYNEQDDQLQAEKYQQLFEARTELEYNAMKERESVSAKDQFIAHELSQDQVDDLLAQLREFSNIKKVFLVRKQTSFLSHIPCYVLAFSIKQGFGKISEDAVIQTMRFLHEKVQFPGETFLMSLDLQQNSKIKRKMSQLVSAKII